MNFSGLICRSERQLWSRVTIQYDAKDQSRNCPSCIQHTAISPYTHDYHLSGAGLEAGKL